MDNNLKRMLITAEGAKGQGQLREIIIMCFEHM